MASVMSWTMPMKELLTRTFAPGFAQAVWESDATIHHHEIAFGRHVIEMAQSFAPPGISLTSAFPTSRDDFFTVLKDILSNTARTQITQNTDHFNTLTESSVCDNLFTHRTFSAWLRDIIEGLMQCHLATIDRYASTSITSGPFGNPGSVSSRPTAPSLVQRDLAMSNDGVDDENNKVVKVTLRGSSITSAWRSNTDLVDFFPPTQLRHLTSTSCLPCTGPSSSPAQPANTAVFHGTDNHFKGGGMFWPDSWERSALNLHGADEEVQMNPRGVKAVYTAFSPLRAFIWAAFKASVFANVPTPFKRNEVMRAFTVNGRSFKGVAVFMFQVSTPCASDKLSAAVLGDASSSQAFSNGVKMLNISGSPDGNEWNPDQAWQRLAHVHKSSLKTWPHVLHSHEFGGQERELARLECNMYRTCWSGPGIKYLNSQYKRTLAITFEYMPPLAPPKSLSTPTNIPKDKGKDMDDDREGKDKEKDVKGKGKAGQMWSNVITKTQSTLNIK